MTLLWERLHILAWSANRLLLVAGTSAIAIGAVGISVGRSPVLSVGFFVVGCTLIGISPYAPRAPVGQFTTATAPVDVVVASAAPPLIGRPHRHRKLASGISLVLLLILTILVLVLVFVAAVAITFLVLSGQ